MAHLWFRGVVVPFLILPPRSCGDHYGLRVTIFATAESFYGICSGLRSRRFARSAISRSCAWTKDAVAMIMMMSTDQRFSEMSLHSGKSLPPPPIEAPALTVMIMLPELLICFVLPLYVPKMFRLFPSPVGVYDTEQLAVVPLPFKVQLRGLKEPIPFEERGTIPVGVVAPDPDMAVTVAVQIVFEFTTSED